MKLDAQQLRELEETTALPDIKRRPVYFILDNIYDTYNIGGLFRLADALAIEKIYLCGDTETPPNSRIKKASIGTYKVVPWEYCTSAEEAISKLKVRTSKLIQKTGVPTGGSPRQRAASRALTGTREGQAPSRMQIVAIEQHKKAIPYANYNYIYPLALVVGNETTGVSKEALEASDAIVEIPMYGINKSLNVIVSAAIVAYFVNQKIRLP